MLKKRIIVPFMIILALFLTACGTNNTTDPVDNQNDATNNEVTNENTTENDATNENTTENDTDATEEAPADEYESITVMPEEAFDIYMDKYPNSLVKQIQIDKSMGNYLYKVEGFEANMEYEIEIDPISGTITKEHSETDDDMDDMEISRADAEKVMAIVDKAITEAGVDATLEEWTLDMDDGRVELEVEIDQKGLDKVEHTYDVNTGQLIEMDD